MKLNFTLSGLEKDMRHHLDKLASKCIEVSGSGYLNVKDIFMEKYDSKGVAKFCTYWVSSTMFSG